MLNRLNLVSATDSSAKSALAELSRSLTKFYNDAAKFVDYYEYAHKSNQSWKEDSFHNMIKRQMRSGMKILDLGCGSGHAFENLCMLDILYTGVDCSEEQIRKNKFTYGAEATFLVDSLYGTTQDKDQYDVVFSLYVLEHLVWPHVFLKEMVRLTKPGGLIILLCPNFRPFGRIPSLRYGVGVAPLKEKLKSGHIADAIVHYFLRNIYYPAAVHTSYPRTLFPFLINLEPTCLTGKYYVDNDAVYFVDQEEVESFLRELGCDLVTQKLLEEAGKPRENGTCFVAARKAGL